MKIENNSQTNNSSESKIPISEISTLRSEVEEDFINIIENKVKILDKLSKNNDLNMDNFE